MEKKILEIVINLFFPGLLCSIGSFFFPMPYIYNWIIRLLGLGFIFIGVWLVKIEKGL